MHRLLGTRGLAAAAALGLALFAATGREVRADLTITVDYGLVSHEFTILGNGGTVDQAQLDELNTELAAVNANYVFKSLGGTTSTPEGCPGFLTQGGEVQSTGAHASGDTITITATAVDYFSPIAPTSLFGGGGSTFTNTQAGNNSTFTSWFNANNLAGATTPPGLAAPVALSPGGPDPHTDGGDAGPLGIAGNANSNYSLTNRTEVTITGGTATIPAIDQFKGSTVVICSTVPEPATMTMTLIALPMFFTLPFFRNRRAKA